MKQHVDDEDRRCRALRRRARAGTRSSAARSGTLFPRDARRARRRCGRSRFACRSRTTTPRPEPSRTIVPISAHDALPCSTGTAFFSTGTDSPVRTASSHDISFASSRRRSAGTMSPTASRMMSPGTRSTTSTRRGVPSRTTTAVCTIWLWSAFTACSERILVQEARDRPRGRRSPPMMTASVPEPTNAREGRSREQQEEQRVVELAEQDRGPIATP